MQPAPLPDDELERLAALRSYQILDTGAEQVFDDLTELAAHICGTPIALVSLVDEHRQWFKSRVGLDASETPREVAFCAHAILASDLFVVGNALEDDRFADNPLVTGDPGIRFYAGAPLVDHDGHGLGTLCVIDKVARDLTPPQTRALEALSRQVISQLQLRKTLIEQRDWNTRLLTAKREAEDANRTKSRFLAHMSHELRTPLNAVIGFAKVLRKQTTEKSRDATLLERIVANGQHLLQLINNVLDLSRIEAQRVEPRLEGVEVNSLVREVATQVESLVEQHGNVLQVVTPPSPVVTSTDPTLVRQCLLNLLSNAAKFTENGSIQIGVSTETTDHTEWVTLQVADTGEGMSQEDLDGMFGEFYRAARPDLGHREGTGLGLAITKKLCGLLGGDVTATSQRHHGSTFTIRLPRREAPSPSEQPGSSSQPLAVTTAG